MHRKTRRLSSRRAAYVLALACACTGVDAAGPRTVAVEPAGVHLHRLNALEYGNAIEAAVPNAPDKVWATASDLPVDDPADGFDNVANTLTTSPARLQIYASVASWSADAAVSEQGPLSANSTGCGADAACRLDSLLAWIAAAWRRPLQASERQRISDTWQELGEAGFDVDERTATLAEATLLSPHFLFRVEDSDPPGADSPLTEVEIANRLAFFLWSGPPDARLHQLADQGQLSEPTILRGEIDRMLDDPRASNLADSFGAQWLGYRYLPDVFKDQARFPIFDNQLRASMAAETRALFLATLEENADLRTLLTSERSFIDQGLAQVYGLPSAGLPPMGEGLAEVDLAATDRRGILTHSGWLSAQAYGFTTSPARRGRWVLEELLCYELGDPPPGVDAPVDAIGEEKLDGVDAHSSDPACAGCHQLLDGVGLSFEVYDAIGQAQDPQVVAAAGLGPGTLPDGQSFEHPTQLGPLIAEDPAFLSCSSQKLMRFALGRSLGTDARNEAVAIAEAHQSTHAGLRDLVIAIAMSESFRTRHEEAAR